jgi:perosamine synthetase
MKNISKQIYLDIKKICKRKSHALHEPNFGRLDKKYLINCINSTYVSTFGPYTNKLENSLSKFTKSKKAVATINATSGLFLCLKSLGVNTSHEVLVPSLTFVGSVNAISYCGATPHFIDVSTKFNDIDYEELDIYLKKIAIFKNNNLINKKTKKIIKCIIPVHLFGHPCDMDKCLQISKKYNMFVVEDCAEALGSKYKGRHVGNFGNCGVVSFNGNKIITTGGGGMVISNSIKLSNKINHLASVAKKSKNYEISHDDIGYNFKLPNLNSSLGLAQMKKLKVFINKKRKLFLKYSKVIQNNIYMDLMKEPKNCRSNYWLQTIILKKKYQNKKNLILNFLNKKNISVRPVWQLIHSLKPYKLCPKMLLKNSNEAYKRIIHIPSGSQL